MKFQVLSGQGASHERKADEALEKDYREAIQTGALRIGTENVFFKSGLKTCCIPFSETDRVFRRVIAVPAGLCCGSMNVEIETIVFARDGKELAQVQMPGSKAAREAFAILKETLPDVLFQPLPADPDKLRAGTVVY